LDSLRIEFSDGRIWEIDVQDQLTEVEADAMADRLLSIFNEYRDDIKKIDFKMNIEKLKKDIKNETKKIL